MNAERKYFETGRPIAYIKSVIEADFGCEGRDDFETVYAEIEVITDNGEEKWKIEESVLWCSGLDDGMWLAKSSDEKLIVINSNREPIAEIDKNAIKRGDLNDY